MVCPSMDRRLEGASGLIPRTQPPLRAAILQILNVNLLVAHSTCPRERYPMSLRFSTQKDDPRSALKAHFVIGGHPSAP